MTDEDPVHKRAHDIILALALERGRDKTLCPSEATRALAGALDRDDWQSLSPLIREVATEMIDAGKIVMRKKGDITPPAEMKGAFRLGLPPEE
ncbi:MAG: DUF3253 domain-containing protein [Pseudomonadota bacterium]